MKYRKWLSSLVAAAVIATEPAVAAEYLIGVGDVLELSVIGVPELQYKSSVAPGGRASFPLVEDIVAEGRLLSDVREELRAKLSQKVAPRSDGKGVEDTVSFSAEQISLVIAEYRPIYITGHIAQPGEQRYRVGMTAREAVAVAGGVALLPGGAGSGQGRSATLTQGLNVQAEYSVMLNELAREQVRLSRLQAEYQGKTLVELSSQSNESARSQPQSDVFRLEAERLASREAGQAKEKTHLQQSAEKVEKHLALLTERRAKEAASLEADQGDFNRASELFRNGITVAGRVSEARRTVLLSATQLLQTDASIAAAERELLTLRRESARLDERRRDALITELQDTTLRIQNLQAKLMFAAQQVALLPSPNPQALDTDEVQVVVVRRTGAGRQRITAELDTELMPGDVVEISSSSGLVGTGPTARR